MTWDWTTSMWDGRVQSDSGVESSGEGGGSESSFKAHRCAVAVPNQTPGLVGEK